MTALDAAQAELADAMVPWPDDYVEDLSPQAALLVLRQMSMATLKVIAGASISLQDDPEGDSGVIGEITNGVAACVAGSTMAMVALELLPKEALEAIS